MKEGNKRNGKNKNDEKKNKYKIGFGYLVRMV
jgi:hypothetical protein